MPHDRLDAALATHVEQLHTTGTAKGAEAVVVGVRAADGERGPRFELAGEGDRQFIRMNSNSYLGMALRGEVITAEEAAVARANQHAREQAKALAAQDNNVPFYVALPGPTIDWTLHDGVRQIPIEQRSPDEVTRMTGRTDGGEITTVTITPDGSPAANYAFDVTPRRLVTGLITERGVARATPEGLAALYPEKAQ